MLNMGNIEFVENMLSSKNCSNMRNIDFFKNTLSAKKSCSNKGAIDFLENILHTNNVDFLHFIPKTLLVVLFLCVLKSSPQAQLLCHSLCQLLCPCITNIFVFWWSLFNQQWVSFKFNFSKDGVHNIKGFRNNHIENFTEFLSIDSNWFSKFSLSYEAITPYISNMFLKHLKITSDMFQEHLNILAM